MFWKHRKLNQIKIKTNKLKTNNKLKKWERSSY
jgi:hypothetical protein